MEHIEISSGRITQVVTHSRHGSEVLCFHPANQPQAYFVDYQLDGASISIWQGEFADEAIKAAKQIAKEAGGIPVINLCERGM